MFIVIYCMLYNSFLFIILKKLRRNYDMIAENCIVFCVKLVATWLKKCLASECSAK